MSDFYCNQILNGKIEVTVVFETKLVLAFNHTQPYFERHIVITPKQHIESLNSDEVINSELALDFITAIHHVLSLLEKETDGGANILTNITSFSPHLKRQHTEQKESTVE